MIIFAVLMVLIGGFCSAAQSPTNAALSNYVGNFQSALISFGGGLICMIIGVITAGSGDFQLIGEAPWWQWIGGLYGAYMVLMITFTAPVLGIALTLTVNMLGQIVMGIIIDTFGLFGAETLPFNMVRVIGAIAVCAGVFLVYIGKSKQGKKLADSKGKTVAVVILMFLAGVGAAIQTPTNAGMAEHIGKMEAGLVSFGGGFLVLLIFTLIYNKGKFQKVGGVGIKPWMVTGGLYGAAVVFFNIVAMPYLGAALVVATAMFGSLAGALVIDNFGLFRATKVQMNWWRYVGVAIIAVGVVIVTLARI